MADVRLKYATKRRNSDGSLRWYWQRPGRSLLRLPDDPVARAKTVLDLNAEADAQAEPDGQAREGSMAWLVAKYKTNDVRIGKQKPYATLAENTKRNYKRWLGDLESRLGHLDIGAFTKRVCVDWVNAVDAGSRAVAAGVLKNLLGYARYLGFLADNPAADLGGPKGRRTTLWTAADFVAFFAECDKHARGQTVRDGVTLMLYTGQRPSDAIPMSLNDFDGDLIAVVQQKTGKRLLIPAHSKVREIRDRAKAEGRFALVPALDGGALGLKGFERLFMDIRKKAGLEHLQMRDLRRTAAHAMKMLGLDDKLVTSITGHELGSFQSSLKDVYVPSGVDFARQAMKAWEDSGK